MPPSKDSNVPHDAQNGGADSGTPRPGGASFAALYARQGRLSGVRLLRPGRRAVVSAIALLALVALIGGVAVFVSRTPAGGDRPVAAGRPAADVASSHRNAASSSPTARDRGTTTHSGGPQQQPSNRPSAHHGKVAGAGSAGATGGVGHAGGGPGTGGGTGEKAGAGTAGGTGTTGGTSGGTGGNGTTTPASGPLHITGQLLCESGHAVVGVWVQTATASDSRYAAWRGIGDGSTADWWTDLPKNESYTLNVGCGGTKASWATSNSTGWYSGGHNSFNCDDIAGKPDYQKCSHR